MQYPTRQKFFAMRFIRVMTKVCVAQELGPTGFTLLSIIATTEDAAGYRRHVTYYDGQLAPIIGVDSQGALARARKKCVESGWLHYEHGCKGKASKYWVIIPTYALGIDDNPTDEGDDYSRLSLQNGDECAGQSTIKRDQSDAQTTIKREASAEQARSKQQPFLPIPIPIPEEPPNPQGGTGEPNSSTQEKSNPEEPNPQPPSLNGEANGHYPDLKLPDHNAFDQSIKRRKKPEPFDAPPGTLAGLNALINEWNLASGVVRVATGLKGMTPARQRLYATRAKSATWIEDYRTAIAKFPLPCFVNSRGWRPDFDWFMRPDTVIKIIEGSYDWEKQNDRPIKRTGKFVGESAAADVASIAVVPSDSA